MKRAVIGISIGVLVALLGAGCTTMRAIFDPPFSQSPLPPSGIVQGGPSMTVDDPLTLPRWTPSFQKVASIRIPKTDGAGGLIEYGGGASWVSEDGRRLVVSCWEKNGQGARGTFAELELPAPGGLAKVLSPCTGIPESDFAKVGTDPNCWLFVMRGYAEVGGRTMALADCTYDAANTVRRQVFVGPSRSSLGGPFGSSVAPGMAKGPTREIPAAWRALLGGDTMVSTAYSSIVGRSSYGPGITVFNAADVTQTPFASSLLMACPQTDGQGQTLSKCVSRWGAPSTLLTYNGSEESGGLAILPGTRTLMIVDRESKGPTCYGYATRDKALHGTPYPTAANPSPEGVPWCWSLSDTENEKGPKGYPYTLVARLVDLGDLVAVKQGKLKPWDVEPYAVVEFPGVAESFAFGYVGGGAVNLARCEYYAVGQLNRPQGGAEAVVETWSLGNCAPGAPPPPPPPGRQDCVVSWGPFQRVAGSESACFDDHGVQRRTYRAERTYTIMTPPANGGAACPAQPERQTPDPREDCPVGSPPPPPPPPPTLTVTATARTRSCTLTATANQPPPDGTGWGVRFYRRLEGDVETSHGNRDVTVPYVQSAAVSLGTWEIRAEWTRSGATAVPVPAIAVTECQP